MLCYFPFAATVWLERPTSSAPPVLSSITAGCIARSVAATSEATLSNCPPGARSPKFQISKPPAGPRCSILTPPPFLSDPERSHRFFFFSLIASRLPQLVGGATQRQNNCNKDSLQVRNHAITSSLQHPILITTMHYHIMRACFAIVPLLTFLSLAAAASSAGRAVAKASGPPSFFIRDMTDGLCLGGEIFKRCGIDTLWFVEGKAGAYQLHRRLVDEVDLELCLGKTHCHLEDSPTRLSNCNHCGTQKWNILGDEVDGGFQCLTG